MRRRGDHASLSLGFGATFSSPSASNLAVSLCGFSDLFLRIPGAMLANGHPNSSFETCFYKLCDQGKGRWERGASPACFNPSRELVGMPCAPNRCHPCSLGTEMHRAVQGLSQVIKECTGL